MSAQDGNITDMEAEEALRLDGFDMDEKYPEFSGASLIQAYQSGYKDAAYDNQRQSGDGGTERVNDKIKRVEALLEQYEADDREHLNTFGQHHPYAGWAADHLREALTGEA